jgi:hypothetical protein
MANIQDDLQTRWWNLEKKLMDQFGKKPDTEAVLFLIGLQETGFIREKITKEQKQDLMHIAICSILSPSGYYLLEGKDDEGWPHFKQLKQLPVMNLMEQEVFLKEHILLYFDNIRYYQIGFLAFLMDICNNKNSTYAIPCRITLHKRS